MSPFNLVLAPVVILVGALLAATPYIMPPTECFTVTVPPSAKSDPRIRAIYRRYTIAVVAATLVCAAICLLISSHGAAIAAVSILPIVLGFAAMLYARAQVRAIKEQEGWAASQRRSAAIIADDSAPRPISLAWNLLFLVLVAVLAVACIALYDRFPDRIPMQVGFDGTVTRYADKTGGTVLFPAIITAFMGAIFAISHWMICRSKKPIDPAAPASSALAYGSFARAQSIILLAGGLILCATMGITFILSSMKTISMQAAAIIVSVAGVGFVIAELWLSIARGQSGARLATELRDSDEIVQDDDARWILGSFYFNPDDPSFTVPKRFGVGWTINFASRTALLIIAGLILVTIVFAVVVENLL